MVSVSISLRNSFGQAYGSWGPEGLTGFSLRADVSEGLNSNGPLATGQIIVDTLLRNRVLYIELSNTFDTEKHGSVVEYKVLQSDGKPLPKWMHQAGKGLLLAEFPAETQEIKLKIAVIFADGTLYRHAINIQTASGEVDLLRNNVIGNEALTFGEALKQANASEMNRIVNVTNGLDSTNPDEAN